MTFPSLALLLALTSPVSEGRCGSYVGRNVDTRTFDEVRSALPIVAERGPYESTADYQRRLSGAAGGVQDPVVVRRTTNRKGDGLSYDPDRQILTVYGSAFGTGEINFSHIAPLRPADRLDDNFTGAIGFLVGLAEIGQDAYEAGNAYGARVTVTRTTRRVHAIWERAGKLGQSQFLGVSQFKPVARLRMGPDAAKDIIEGGGGAILFVPKSPYQASGTSTLDANFARPRERVDMISVIIADVQCAFLLNRVGTVVHALEVR
jgi:hypothetical protein